MNRYKVDPVLYLLFAGMLVFAGILIACEHFFHGRRANVSGYGWAVDWFQWSVFRPHQPHQENPGLAATRNHDGDSNTNTARSGDQTWRMNKGLLTQFCWTR